MSNYNNAIKVSIINEFGKPMALLIWLCSCIVSHGQIVQGFDIDASVKGTMEKGARGLFEMPDVRLVAHAKAAYSVALRLQSEPVSWLTTDEGKGLLNAAIPQNWPEATQDNDKRLNQLLMEAKLGYPIALALNRNPKEGAAVWPNLPMAVRLVICRYFGMDERRFTSLVFHLKPDNELVKVVLERYLANQSNDLEIARFLSLRMMASECEDDGEHFIRVLVGMLEKSPMDIQLVRIAVNSIPYFERHAHLITNVVGRYLSLAVVVLDASVSNEKVKEVIEESCAIQLSGIKKSLVSGKGDRATNVGGGKQ